MSSRWCGWPGVAFLAVVVSFGTSSAHAQCETQKVAVSAAATADQLGDAVAIDGSWAAVGASRHDFLGSASGAVFVFRREIDPDTGFWQWQEVVRLLAPDGTTNDLFGEEVDLDADDPAGAVIVVGARAQDPPAGGNAGAAYVFRLVGETWTFEQKLLASDGAAGDEFGSSVAIDAGVVAVGAPRHDVGEADAGAAYVFRYTGRTWLSDETLSAATPVANDRLGSAVDVSGDLLLAGAPLSDHAGLNSGLVQPFRWVGTGWVADPVLVATDAGAGDRFGEDVAVDGNHALVGAHLDDEGAENAGAVHAFRFEGGVWSKGSKVRAATEFEDDRFGRSVGILDLGVDEALAVVGADGFNAGQVDTGVAYVLRFDGLDWTQVTRLEASDSGAGDGFGLAVSISLDWILVGANGDDNEAGVNAGAAYVFTSGLEVDDDCNMNGESDFCEISAGLVEDCDGNAIPDECEIDDPLLDANGNGTLDACEDCNDNGTPDPDEIDLDPALDCDANGLLDVCQIAFDSPARGGPFYCEADCDPDCDGNGIPDACDLFGNDCNTNDVPDTCDIAAGTSLDRDGNGVPDECDTDCNDNGIPDQEDLAAGTSLDCDGNSVPDECDIAGGVLDCNDNLVPDECEIEGGANDCDADGIPDDCQDCNGNGLSDVCDVDSGGSLDLNGNGVPDECEDCDGNDIPDFIELEFSPELDCNENDVIDACEIPEDSPAGGGPYFCEEDCDPDCNANGVPDSCDLADGTSMDCDANGVPDICDPDCNANGVPDTCDVTEGTSPDRNGNGIPDECEDCNDNGVPDDMDIAQGTSLDCNANGVPDACDVDPADPDGDGVVVADCQPNGIPDSCDIDEGASDFNENGEPDECEGDCDGDGLPDFLEILLQIVEDCNANGIPDPCDIDPADPDGNGLVSPDANGDGVPDECDGSCPADVDLDGQVGFLDLLEILSAWGTCEGCPTDLDGDGEVGFLDLLEVLSAWGRVEVGAGVHTGGGVCVLAWGEHVSEVAGVLPAAVCKGPPHPCGLVNHV